jgi:probable dihydroxyacetone kinase regulator
MEDKKDLTKHLIAESVKELVKTMPFEKLTIKRITDKAGLIRPAFYRYFLDKYDVIDWILRTEVLEDVFREAETGDRKGALTMLFSKMGEEKEFYRKVFQISGQNSIEESLERQLMEWYKGVLEKEPGLLPAKGNPVLEPERVAAYKSAGLARFIKDWILDVHMDPTPQQLTEAFCYLTPFSFFDEKFPRPDEKEEKSAK